MGDPVAPGVSLEDAPGHNPGMHAVWVSEADQHAVVVGHLFLHPAQIAPTRTSTTGDLIPVVLEATPSRRR